MQPLVSLGLPVYNGEKTLRDALDSLIGQDYTSLEIVISDNASTDATPDICREYAARDRRVRWSRAETLLPLYSNWQRVFELTRGDFFLWCAADDRRPREAVRRLLGALLANDRAVLAHGPIELELVGTPEIVDVQNAFPSAGLDLAGRVRAYVKGIQHVGMMHGLFRRSAMDRLPLLFDPAQSSKGGPYGQDYLFNLRALTLGEVAWIPEPMLHYCDQELLWVRLGDSLGLNVRWTLRNLFRAPEIQRRKAWTLLRQGRLWIRRAPDASDGERRRAVGAFTRAFIGKHAAALFRGAMFQLGWVLSEGVRRILPRAAVVRRPTPPVEGR